MVTQHVKSFFLNELDSLMQNRGVLTIATMNHLEHVDEAMVNCPSRPDIKCDFACPV
jgi:AAA+ superfamily predicted ATPase